MMNLARVAQIVSLYAELDPEEKRLVDQKLWASVDIPKSHSTMTGAQVIAMMEAENLWWDLEIEDSLDYVAELRRRQWASGS
jgi:hypothetical protein